MSPQGRQRLIKALVSSIVVCGLIAINAPTIVSAARDALHDYKINSQGYKEARGHWSMLNVPQNMRVNAIHAALLRTGKVLLIAGSGNNQDNFNAKKFDTRIWDPVKGTIKKIDTPKDLFCTGHPAGQRQSSDRGRYEAVREAQG